MIEFFKNKWTKRAVSLLSPVYCGFAAYFAYMSVFYELVVRNPVQFCILLSALSLIALILMLYTRRQFLTILTSLLLLPCMLLPTLLYFGQWEVLIPPLIVAVVIFFFSGMGETGKTVCGTGILLLYLIGSLVYFLVTSMFAPSTVTTVVQAGTSESGIYHYEVIETVDSSDGSTKVTVESNALDRDYDMLLFKVRGLERDVKIERPLNQNVTIEWKTEKRQDISQQLKQLSDDIEITLSDAQMDLLGRAAYQITYKDGRSATLMQADYHSIVVPLTAEEQELLKTSKTELRLDEMSDNALNKLGIQVENFRTVKLSSLTDEELARLGVPEEGDVMYYNGTCVFRYYVAILEEYFDISKQDLGLF